MKQLNLISLLLLFALFISSCETEEEEPDECAPQYTDQTLAGSISGESFNDPHGIAEVSSTNEDELNFHFYIISEGEGCELTNAGKKHYISFTLPRFRKDLEGSHELGVFDGRIHAVSFHIEESTKGATCGGIEITGVSGSEISGRIDAEFDGENTVNGTFTVPRCE